jgi:ABC-type nickel/cobalt efflux system permease component RcnA
MNINESVAGLENRIAQSTRPWMRITAAILLIGIVGVLIYRQVTSPVKIVRPPAAGSDAKASAQFGEALQKAGIQTQEGPSR